MKLLSLQVESFTTGPVMVSGYYPSDYTCNYNDGCDDYDDPPWTAAPEICGCDTDDNMDEEEE